MRKAKSDKRLIGHRGKTIIIVTSIVVLNIFGVSYGHWNEGLAVQTSVLTGSIDPVFDDRYQVDWVQGSGNLSVGFDDHYNMKITGDAEPGSKAVVHYYLTNQGSIPVKFKEQQGASRVQRLGEELEIKLDQDPRALGPENGKRLHSGNDKSSLQIQISGDANQGRHKFEVEIPFQQWTGEDFE